MNSTPPANGHSEHEEQVPLLEVRNLTKDFRVGGIFSGHTIHAVKDVNFSVLPGEIVALVGQSGSGKSTIARLLAGIYPVTSGTILFRGSPLPRLRSQRALRSYRGQVQMVFQDPYASLNPIYPASRGIVRALKLHRRDLSRVDRRRALEELLASVGLVPADEFIRKYPYELSGGQRQRYGFAQALACKPDVILADEPVSMLDVSIRAGILNLMADLREREDVSFLYITHDIASARYVADRILVMYRGEIIERGPTEEVLQNPTQEYTQELLAAVPDPNAPIEDW